MAAAKINISGGPGLQPRHSISSELEFTFGLSHDICCWAIDIQGSVLGPGHQKRELEAP